MNLIDIFKRTTHSYKSSPNAPIYEKIAEANETEPQRVYELAHGKKPKSYTDEMILQDLVTEGILK